MTLNVTLSQTSRGDQDYLQVMDDDQVSVNVVLIADQITVRDVRPLTRRRVAEAAPSLSKKELDAIMAVL